MNQKPEIAIIEPNTLTALGLKSILEKIIPMAVIRTFHNFGELVVFSPTVFGMVLYLVYPFGRMFQTNANGNSFCFDRYVVCC